MIKHCIAIENKPWWVALTNLFYKERNHIFANLQKRKVRKPFLVFVRKTFCFQKTFQKDKKPFLVLNFFQSFLLLILFWKKHCKYFVINQYSLFFSRFVNEIIYINQIWVIFRVSIPTRKHFVEELKCIAAILSETFI